MKKSYLDACHAMQSGVAMKMNIDPRETSPKHLRVGVNSAMSDNAALVKLLLSKGIITKEEYAEAVTDQMNIEVEAYEIYLSEYTGKKVTLG